MGGGQVNTTPATLFLRWPKGIYKDGEIGRRCGGDADVNGLKRCASWTWGAGLRFRIGTCGKDGQACLILTRSDDSY